MASNGTILFVDDEPSLVELGKLALERMGYKVITALDGLSALERYDEASGEVRLVILDLSMPQMSGFDTFVKLKERNTEVKVLISSGFDASGVIEKMMANGALGVLQKPYRMNILQDAVREQLGE